MWLGLLLIVLRLFTTSQWDTLKASFQAVTSEGLTPVTNSDAGLLQAGEGFSLPGSAAIPGIAADITQALHLGTSGSNKGRKPIPPGSAPRG